MMMARPLYSSLLKRSLYIFVATLPFAGTDTADAGVKENVWELNTSFQHLNYSDKDLKLIGNGGALNLGYGKVREHSRYGITVDIILGPYTRLREERIKTDFSGTGISLRTAYALFSGGFRDPSGGWGIGATLSYSDIVGRSVASSRESVDGKVISDLSMRISSLTAQTGIYYARFQPSRPVGNTPDLLITRIEGYSFFLDFGYPLKTTYKVQYLETQNNGESGDKETDRQERGPLNGYLILSGISVFFGT